MKVANLSSNALPESRATQLLVPIHFQPVENARDCGIYIRTTSPPTGPIIRAQIQPLDYGNASNDVIDRYILEQGRKEGLPFGAARSGKQGMCRVCFDPKAVIGVIKHYIYYDTSLGYMLGEQSVGLETLAIQRIFVDRGIAASPDREGYTRPYAKIIHGDRNHPTTTIIETVDE